MIEHAPSAKMSDLASCLQVFDRLGCVIQVRSSPLEQDGQLWMVKLTAAGNKDI